MLPPAVVGAVLHHRKHPNLRWRLQQQEEGQVLATEHRIHQASRPPQLTHPWEGFAPLLVVLVAEHFEPVVFVVAGVVLGDRRIDTTPCRDICALSKP